jgi:hypothetical protein
LSFCRTHTYTITSPPPPHPQLKCKTAETILQKAKGYLETNIAQKEAKVKAVEGKAEDIDNNPVLEDVPAPDLDFDSDSVDVESDEEDEEDEVGGPPSRQRKPNKTVLQTGPFIFPAFDAKEREGNDYNKACDDIL